MNTERMALQTPVPGTTFVIDCRGDAGGLDVVWLHGEFGVLDAPPGLERIADHGRVLEVHLPGWGVSEGGDRFDRIEELALATWWAIDRVGVDRPIIAGHGFGGTLAVEMAIQQPLRVRALALAAPFGMFLADDPGVDVFATMQRDVMPALYADASSALVASHFPPVSDAHERGLAAIRRVQVLGATSRYLFPIPDTNIEARAYVLERVPMTIRFGAVDGLVPAAVSRLWSAAFPHASVEVVDGVGHMLPFESLQFAETLAELVEAQSAAV